MVRTSISCSEESKAAVEERKRDDETWDACLLRLANEEDEPSDIDEVVEKLEQLEETLERMETTVERRGSSGGSATADVNAIREAVRAEVRDQLQDFLR